MSLKLKRSDLKEGELSSAIHNLARKRVLGILNEYTFYDDSGSRRIEKNPGYIVVYRKIIEKFLLPDLLRVMEIELSFLHPPIEWEEMEQLAAREIGNIEISNGLCH